MIGPGKCAGRDSLPRAYGPAATQRLNAGEMEGVGRIERKKMGILALLTKYC